MILRQTSSVDSSSAGPRHRAAISSPPFCAAATALWSPLIPQPVVPLGASPPSATVCLTLSCRGWKLLPGYQGRGIGTQLFSRMLTELDRLYSVNRICDPELKKFLLMRRHDPTPGHGVTWHRRTRRRIEIMNY